MTSTSYIPPSVLHIPQGLLDFPAMEEDILNYWDQIQAFETQLRLTRSYPPFNFYDGPPFATGLPHYGHLLAGTIKDVVCRYYSMNRRYVSRRFGWDCHGLPVEYEVDKMLDVKSPSDVINKIGIRKYNQTCRSIVMRYSQEWEAIVKRSGRWIDFKRDYKTMNLLFMESVWWVFKELYNKGLVYEGTKVMPYSTACATPLSNFEANLNYKEVQDMTCIVSFPVIVPDTNREVGGTIDKNVNEEKISLWKKVFSSFSEVHLVAWTTTPWTLPSNLALCVNPSLNYLLCRRVLDPDGGEVENSPCYLVAESLVRTLLPPLVDKKTKKETPTHEVLHRFIGQDLAGLRYDPLFPYFKSSYGAKHACWKVVADDYVTSDSGVGIVHIAPFFGEDDYRVGLENNIIVKDGDIVCPLDDSGKFLSDVIDFAGLYVKDANKPILKYLKEAGRLVSQSTCTHSYPYCWRSDTPLIYRAIPSWFIRVEQIKDSLIRNNLKASWVPKAIQEKRFHNWLENARDWSISRNRFWGCPIPIWMSADKTQLKVIGSISELSELTGVPLTRIRDIHRDYLDSMTIPDPRGPDYPPMRRISPVFDCWFESGSMPYAQKHYPFHPDYKKAQGVNAFLKEFPGDFIAEGLDQTRGWFYTLLILSTALFDSPPSMNCIVNGLVLASDGQKMSKRVRNYPDVNHIINTYGSDALRLYLVNSPAVRAQELRFREEGVKGVTKDLFVPWYNSFRFFTQQATRYREVTGKDFLSLPIHSEKPLFEEALKRMVTSVLDMWILTSFEQLVATVRREMASYQLYNVLPELLRFIDDLTKWYIRFNRDTLKGEDGVDSAYISLNVLFYILFMLCRLMAPYTPFVCDWMYLQLRPVMNLPGVFDKVAYRSIHFWAVPSLAPDTFKFQAQPNVIQKMTALKDVIMLGRMVRKDKCGVTSFKMPLGSVTIAHDRKDILDELKTLVSFIQSELNVLEVNFHVGEEGLATFAVIPDFIAIKEAYAGDKKVLGNVINKVKGLCDISKPENLAFVKELRKTGRCQLDGIVVTSDLCKVMLEPIPVPNYASAADENGFLCSFDTRITQEIKQKAAVRILFSKIQQLRRRVGMDFRDRADVYVYSVQEGDELVQYAIDSIADRLNGTIRYAEPGNVESESAAETDTIENDIFKCMVQIVKY
ncbi:Isoleucyl-tRNA synthetase [Giardia lamblia P15]|uniref:isoleucine--tRNA ligase n=1 Tax=Giardia intestinalis (strain P15) TaxID=658858 RepID=E1F440_GIAIA|nr:Isoleucyl-tRNA synthetase [Giardia lamblia P15]